MLKIRIIPRLDIKGANVVKGIHCEGLRVVGNPKELAYRYYKDWADELLCVDIVASLYQRNFDFNLLRSLSNGIFIPITVGGGISSINDINNALRAGADKVAINTYAVKNPIFLNEAAKKFGSQCIALSIEAKRKPAGGWEAYTDGGREKTGIDAISWAKKAIKLGVGEIILTSIDCDGTRKGYDTDLISAVASFSPVPLIVHGGANNPNSFLDVLKRYRLEGLSAASIFHYKDFSIKDVKKYLLNKNLPIRYG